jgi:O-succinylbenzoic acid--CoA ligase
VCEVASQQLAFKGPSLFTTYAMFQQDNLIFHDPKQEGWFISTDRGYLDNGYLTPLGRLNQMVKIGGENVDLAKLEAILAHVAPQKEIALVAVPDPRLEHSLLIAYTGCKTEAEYYVLEFNQHVLPFERVRATHAVPYIPKNALGKIQYPLLLAMLVAI